MKGAAPRQRQAFAREDRAKRRDRQLRDSCATGINVRRRSSRRVTQLHGNLFAWCRLNWAVCARQTRVV